MKRIRTYVILLLAVCLPLAMQAKSVRSYAQWMADSEMKRCPEAWQLDYGKAYKWSYSVGVECAAMLDMWKATGDRKYYDYVKAWTDSMVSDKGIIRTYKMEDYNLDYINDGKVLLEVYKESKEEKLKKAMKTLVKQLRKQPRTFEGGFWHKLIYQHQMWLDGIYMASPFMAEYGATFHEPEWIDEAVRQFTICRKHTYTPENGLYHHGWDESRNQRWANKETGNSPCYWGRSMGWWFMAMVDALDYIPSSHAGYAPMVEWIQQLADALPKYQDKDGLWYQVLDQPTREGNWPEASVTAQFMYAYAKAVNKHYLSPKYKAVAEKAFNGLKKKLLKENEDGTLTLTRCCEVSGLGGKPYRDGSYTYYIHEKVRDNDAKAVGPFIMGCLQLGK